MPEATAASLFAFDIVRSGNEAIVRCRGKLVAGMNDHLYADVSKLIPDSKRIVLDLTELTHMDSMGLGTVVRLYVSGKASGCDLQLINLGPRIRQLLGVTNLLGIFGTVGETGITYL